MSVSGLVRAPALAGSGETSPVCRPAEVEVTSVADFDSDLADLAVGVNRYMIAPRQARAGWAVACPSSGHTNPGRLVFDRDTLGARQQSWHARVCDTGPTVRG